MNKRIKTGVLVVLLTIVTFVLTACGGKDLKTKVDSFMGEKETIGLLPDSEEKPPKDTENQTLSPITGLPIDESTLKRRPLAIMINNAYPARPQSGLDKADLVYEMLAEGGITRFMAIYLHQDLEEVGPVRSARPYYITKALEFDALFVHCGGSVEALEDIKRLQVANLDEIAIGKKAFWRSSKRVAPHNLYTSTDKLRTYASDKGKEGEVDLPAFKFLKAGEKNQNGQGAKDLLLKYYGKSHKVSYKYDPATNTYLRFNTGVAHVDKITGKQLKATNIIVQFANTITRDDTTLEIDLIGEGKALLFNNGEVYEGVWQKDSLREPTVFLSAQGNEFKLVPGQTWIQVVPRSLGVEY